MQKYSNESPTKMQRREHIVEVAKEMFYKDGVAKTTMKDISNVAGIGRSTMYEYFKSKEELLRLIKRIYLREIYDFNFSIDENMTGFEQLQSILIEYFNKLLEHPKAVVFFMEYNRLATFNKIQDSKIKFKIYKTHEYLSKAIDKGCKDGSLNICNIEKRVEIIIEAIFGAASRFALKGQYEYEEGRDSINKSEMTDLVLIMMNGIKTDKCKVL